MNQNDYIAIGLGTLVVGGLALYGRQLALSAPKPGPQPGPGPFPPAPPGGDPQYEAARQTLATLIAALQAQGGGTQAQRDQAAIVLEQQAATFAAQGSPAAADLLRQAALQLRSGQLPNVPPSPNPAPAPGPLPFPFPPVPPVPVGASAPSGQLLRARDAIARAEREIAEAPANRREVADLLAASAAAYSDRDAAEAMRAAAARLASGAATGQAAPASPSDDLAARYKEMRDHCADYLQGARAIDAATLGAADRTASDLLRAGDANRSADLGALASASYARAGIARPVAVPA